MRDESAAEDLKISMENAPEGKKWKYMKANENLVQRDSTTFPNKKVIVKRQENTVWKWLEGRLCYSATDSRYVSTEAACPCKPMALAFEYTLPKIKPCIFML